MAALLFPFVLSVLITGLCCSQAYGDVGAVLNESMDTRVGGITGAGHSSVYFSNICSDSPIRLRLCRPGEQGSVISTYSDLGEDQPFEWNIVPLSVYLYGVENPQNRPIFGSRKIKRALEERYRENFLSDYCASQSCRKNYKAEWREMVGASLSRSIYIFVVATTVEQDRRMIARFNSLPNQNHFSIFTWNCADFTKTVINTYFPNATRRDYINDFGMTTPKAVARSLTNYALRHPTLPFHVLHFAQLPGTIRRSSECHDGTEQLYHSKKLLIPMILFAPHALIGIPASYLVTGRFNPQRVFEEHPTAEANDLVRQTPQEQVQTQEPGAGRIEVVDGRYRAAIVGTSQEWEGYRLAFQSMAAEAVPGEIILERGYLKRFLKRVDDAGTIGIGENGTLWVTLSNGGKQTKVGVSESNLFAAGSDSELAYELALARTGTVLKSPRHSRETMLEFKNDWEFMQQARARDALSVARAETTAAGCAGTDIASHGGK
jgi:hypothetical protein